MGAMPDDAHVRHQHDDRTVTDNRENHQMNLTRLSVAGRRRRARRDGVPDRSDWPQHRIPTAPRQAPAAAAVHERRPRRSAAGVGAGQLSGTALFAQHLAQVQYVEEDRGRLRTETIDGWFTNAYVTELEDFQKVVQQGKTSNSPNTSGPAKVMQAWVFQNMTDYLGRHPIQRSAQG